MPESYLVECREPVGYLDFARYGPPVHAVVAETTRLLERSSQAGPSTVDDLMRQDLRARSAVARLVGAGAAQVPAQVPADRVALVPNTSTGLFQAASGLVGEVLVARAEFPANTYPWVRSGRARVRWLPAGPVTPEVVRAALTPEVTAVSVSAVDFRTGYRADLAALRDVLGDRLLVVDGIQGFGVVDEPWSVADVVVVGGQKWLRAGWSTGFVALSDRALERLEPTLSGWTGAVNVGLFNNSLRPRAAGAAAWSVTHLSPVAAGALATALELVELAGVQALGTRIVELADELADVVRAAGGTVVSEQARRAGIVAFTLPHVPASAVGAALARAGVTATTRPEHVRLAPHASTTPDTVALLADTLRHLHPTPSAAARSTAARSTAARSTAARSAATPTDPSRSPGVGPVAAGRTGVGPVGDGPVGGGPVGGGGVEGGGEVAERVEAEPWRGTEAGVGARAFPPDVGTYRRMLVERAVADTGVPVSLMRKSHKAQVVRYLDDAGLFQVRDSVDHLAGVLGVTRFTIYNYLNEIRPRPVPEEPVPEGPPSGAEEASGEQE
ncbi:aminotransferase class V-fold PLP-dependent enzyme [Saccharothrix espanaensis]|uniref:Aminotransferase class V n=1 Tax=Saccharothrix espanaensis (strain ATCC 51144 / DSM 44229 / JCM 9112 / NBRC 15066 / NRRL 15764) TaxID=1179773 RepID=K0K004_SACES|nr:Aminotransferase class V [Saccharothrix espanaensis DSM 44229]